MDEQKNWWYKDQSMGRLEKWMTEEEKIYGQKKL